MSTGITAHVEWSHDSLHPLGTSVSLQSRDFPVIIVRGIVLVQHFSLRHFLQSRSDNEQKLPERKGQLYLSPSNKNKKSIYSEGQNFFTIRFTQLSDSTMLTKIFDQN